MNKDAFIAVINRELETLTGTVDLRQQAITVVPSEIGRLTHLRDINLSENQLSSLPPEIGRLTNLSVLRLAHNNLKVLPPEIGQLRGLTKLNVAANQLVTLPIELGQLTNLQELNLSDNNLTQLPAELGELKNLVKLYLPNNNFTDLPLNIMFQLKNLKMIDLAGNQLDFLPDELIKEHSPSAIIAYIRDRITVALSDQRYKWRTRIGIAKASELPIELVTQYLDNAEDIIRAINPNTKGAPLFTTTENYLKKTGLVARVISVMTNKLAE